MPAQEREHNDQQRRQLAVLDQQVKGFVGKLSSSFRSRFGLSGISDEAIRNINCDIFVQIKLWIKQAEERATIVENLKDQLLLLKFPVLLDCLMLYLKARSLGVLVGTRVDKRILEIGETLSVMSDWNDDWRGDLCHTLARAYLLGVTWTYGV